MRFNVFQSISALLVLIISSATILANSAATKGVLQLSDGNSMRVNDKFAIGGLTILSGVELKTDKYACGVDLGPLGHVELAVNTSAKLTFSSSRVELAITTGSGSLTTKSGVTGSLTDPAGRVRVTDPSQATSTIATDGFPLRNSAAISTGWVRVFELTKAAVFSIATIVTHASNGRINVGQVRP